MTIANRSGDNKTTMHLTPPAKAPLFARCSFSESEWGGFLLSAPHMGNAFKRKTVFLKRET